MLVEREMVYPHLSKRACSRAVGRCRSRNRFIEGFSTSESKRSVLQLFQKFLESKEATANQFLKMSLFAHWIEHVLFSAY